MKRPKNEKIIETYLNHYKHSRQSVKTRKSSLNYFFESKYFGYKGHAFEIDTDILIDYFDYLKDRDSLSLSSKKLKWTLLISFLNFSMEYYRKYEFIVIIPKHSINWNGIIHKKPKTNKDVVMTKEEINDILNYLKLRHFNYYIIFRVFTETGMRKGELISINYNDVNLEKRCIKTKGKTGEKFYYISKELSKYLKIYLKERKLRNVNTKALFLSIHSKRFGERQFNAYLKTVLRDLKIKKVITCHTFRRTLNTLRKLMECPDGDLEFLLGHAISLNRDRYVKLTPEQKLELFDKWYPYLDISI